MQGLYATHVSVEFEHIQSEDERLWLYENYELAMTEVISPSEKINMLQLLVRAEEMERFLHKKYGTYKRYSGEGQESYIVALSNIMAEASITDVANSENNLESVVLGMPHRGRLQTITVLCDYPFRNLIHKISGESEIPEDLDFRMDDIPTHIAPSNTKKFIHGGSFHKHHDI